MLWTQTPIHMIDFEGSLASGILEFGVVELRGGRIAATHGRLCRQTGPIREEDAAVHGLNAVAVAHAAPFSEEYERFSAWRSAGPFAAHFANAENSLLRAVWPYHKDAPDFSAPGRRTAEWGPWIDTGRLIPEVFGEVGRGPLATLVERFGLQGRLDEEARIHCTDTRRRFHAALYDALAAALLLLALGERPEFSGMTLGWLLQHSTAAPEKRERLRQDQFEI